VGIGKFPEVRGDINVESEVDRRKHHIDLLGNQSCLFPIVQECLSKNADVRPTAIDLCKTLTDLTTSTNVKSVLEIIQAAEKEKNNLRLQLEQTEQQVQAVLQNTQEMKDQLQREFESLQITLDEERNKSKEQHDAYTSALQGNLDFLQLLHFTSCG